MRGFADSKLVPDTTLGASSPQGAGYAPRQDRGYGAASESALDVASPASSASRRDSIPKGELANLTAQLAIMTRAGVDVATALQSLARQSQRPASKRILESIHQDVIGGKSFSAALQAHEAVFDPTYVATVTAGEASGKMSDVLQQLAKLQRREVQLRSTIRSLLAYPVLLMTVSSLVIMALIFFVLPQFAELFAEYDAPLPAITQVLLGISTEVRFRFWLWGPLAGGAVAALVAFRYTHTGRHMWDGLVLNAFGLRHVTRALYLGRVCRLLGLMLESGVPLLESLRLAKKAVRNSLYRDLFRDMEDDVLNGRGLGDSLTASQFIPPSAAEMMLTAERTGSLGTVTALMGEHYEEDGQTKLRELVTVLEPAITVGMGAIVAVVVLSVMLPMFDIATLGHGQ